MARHKEMKHELEEVQCKVDQEEEAEWVHLECEKKECEEHEKCDAEHRCEGATKEKGELEEVAKA